MHLLLAVIVGIAVFFKADWRNWRVFHPTLFYISYCNLLYDIICKKHYLWKYHPDFLLNHIITDIVYSIWILPCTVLLYISNYPNQESFKKKLIYILKWIILSLAVELVFLKMGRLLLLNGYKFWMEPFFYFLMYTMVRLHHSRPIMTYGFSAIIIMFFIWVFHVPIS